MKALKILLTVSVCLAMVVWGCGEDVQGPANIAPTVELTSGPVEGETVHYSVRLEWAGHDPDGFVDRYEYAVDPPPGFTEEEIAHGGPGITMEEHEGFTRVIKTGPTSSVSSPIPGWKSIFFDWVHTREYSHRFTFSATAADSTDSTSVKEPTGRFTGMHAVYVRAVDNEGAISNPDHVAFTAETVAPESRITRPDIANPLYRVGLNPVIEWTGTDPDGFGTEEPVGYLYALARLDTLGLPPICIGFDCGVLDKVIRGVPWILIDPGETLSPTLDPNRQYVFGVRAVDEAGAVEPFLDYGRNAFKFQAFPDGGIPTVTLCSPSFGCLTFRGEETAEIEVGTGTDLAVTVSCTAESYGETCFEWRWGLDVADLDASEGWSEWTNNPVIPGFRFQNPGVHVLYVEARDSLGNTTLCGFILNVVQLSLDRDVLWVDDALDSVFPTDTEHDAFWRDLLDGYPSGLDWYEFEAQTGSNPVIPSLETLGRYKLLIWENNVGFNGQSALLSTSTLTPILKAYLIGGGKLWVDGEVTVSAMLPSQNGINADLNYPKTEIGPGDFAYDFMKLQSTLIQRDNGTTQKNFLTGVSPYPGGSAGYDSMSVDLNKLRQPFQFALTHVDAVFGPIFAEADPAFVGDIDSLYAYRAYGSEVSGQPSSYHNKLTALRWHDPDPDPLHGRIQWFGFPLYYMFENEAQDTFNKSLDWFREGP